jgi:hypothetical protein
VKIKMKILDLVNKFERLNKKMDILQSSFVQCVSGNSVLGDIATGYNENDNIETIRKAYKNWKGDLLIDFFRKVKK